MPGDERSQNDCPNCRRLSEQLQQTTALLEEATERIQRLERRVEQLEREGKRQAAPFRRPQKKRKKSPRKPGRKDGHKASYRKPPPAVDEHVDVPLDECPHCGSDVQKVRPIEQIIEDIPPVRVHRLHLTTYRGHCSQCGPVASTHPAQVSKATGAAGVHVGKRALALAAAFNKHFGLTMRKTTRVLEQYFGLTISPGGLSQALNRIAKKLADPFEQLCRSVRSSDFIHADETGWWVDGKNAWLWTFTNPEMTLYTIDRRNQQVIRRILGDDYDGVLISDCLNIYDPHPGRKSKCCAHHLRAISEALKQSPHSEFLREVRQFFHTAMMLDRIRDEIDTTRYQAGVEGLHATLDRLLAPTRKDRAERRIANRLRKQRPHLLTFLDYPEVDATNNLAERQLRPAVIARKLSCGNKTQAGAETFSILASVAATCRQQSRSFTDFVANCLSLQRSPPQLLPAE